MTAIFLNGEFVQPEHAQVSAFDAGLTHGVGLFETMTGLMPTPESEPEVIRLWDHMDRLAHSAKELRLSDQLRTQALGHAVLQTVKKCGLPRQRVRLTITGGNLSALASARAPGQQPHDPTILIVAQPATQYPSEMFEQGVVAAIADLKANPFDPTAAHKTLNYWPRLSELQSASAKGAAEALVFQITNHLCGGCVSNAIIVKDGALLTPIVRGEEVKGGLPSAVLPGITRAAVLETARGLDIETTSTMLSIDDVLGADELMLTNSSWGILPIVRVEAEQIANGTPGPITQRLRKALSPPAASAG